MNNNNNNNNNSSSSPNFNNNEHTETGLQTSKAEDSSSVEFNKYRSIVHFSGAVALLIPFVDFLTGLYFWFTHTEKYPDLKKDVRQVFDFSLTAFIARLIISTGVASSTLLSNYDSEVLPVLLSLPMLLFLNLAIGLFYLVQSRNAHNGKDTNYPFSYPFSQFYIHILEKK